MTRTEPTAPLLLRMEGVSKRYGGVRALENANLAISSGPHPCDPRRERRGQVDADQDPLWRRQAGRRTHRARRRRGRLRFARRRQSRGGRLHFPGTLARSRLVRRRQYRDQQSSAPVRAHRPARSAAHRRRGARSRRRLGHPSDGARQGPAALAPADGRDREGARARTPDSHSRRGDVGVDRGGRDQSVRRAETAARRGAGAPLHLAPHARDRRTR